MKINKDNRIFKFLKAYPVSIHLALFIVIGLTYSYHKTSFKSPYSMHKWRQCDVASITLNYYQNGMKFFQPEIHNQMADDGTSGYAVGECPIMYYFVAALYKIFGPHDFIFRLVNLILLYLGLLYLFKIFRIILKNDYWAIFGSLLLFASPALAYYGNNFLTDPPSFSFVAIAWYFVLKLSQNHKKKDLYKALLFFTLGGLLKILSFVNVIAFLALIVIDIFLDYRNKNYKRIFPKFYWHYFVFIITYVLFVFSWYWYSIYYNTLHETNYFLSETNPVWNFTQERRLELFDKIRTERFKEYFLPFSQFIFVGFMVFIFIFRKSLKQIEFYLVLLLFIGSFSIPVLWFWQLIHHDYYIITQLFFPGFALLFTLKIIKIKWPKIFKSVGLKIVFFVFFFFNVSHAVDILNQRYYGWGASEMAQEFAYYQINPYLTELGIDSDDKVIVFPDFAPCYPLYIMNVKGYSGINQQTKTLEGIHELKEKGAKYLITENPLPERYDYLDDLEKYKMGDFFNLSIYSLTDSGINYKPYSLAYETDILCDVENQNGDKSRFISNNALMNYKGVELLDSNFAFSGKYSVKTDSLNPFALTTRIENVSYGDVYEISVLRHKSSAKAQLVISDKKVKKFYFGEKEGVPVQENRHWEKITKVFYVNRKLTDDALNIYIWNPTKEPAWFDDLRIRKIAWDD